MDMHCGNTLTHRAPQPRSSPRVVRARTTTDGTGSAVRVEFALADGRLVEAAVVDLSYRRPRRVVCIPSQVGCSFQCRFCGLRKARLARDLSGDELRTIVALGRQVGVAELGSTDDVAWQVSFMGQGEPLTNIRAVASLTVGLADEDPNVVFGISTIGIPWGIRRLALLPEQVVYRLKLQVSLHATNDSTRRFLMPGTRRWSIGELRDAARLFAQRSGNPVCFNYVLLRGVNDDDASCTSLSSIAEPSWSYVKLSSLNDVGCSGLFRSGKERQARFCSALRAAGCIVKEFVSVGASIKAGCGQIGSCDDGVLPDNMAVSL